MKISSSDHIPPVQLQWTNRPMLKAGAEHGRDNDSVPRSRFLHACCLLGQNVFLYGGKDRYAPLKDFWKLNIVSGEWTQIKTSETALPHLQGHTMVPYKSQIFIFGGTFYETVEEIPLWMYSPDLNILRKYPCDENLPRPMGRREHSAVTHNNFMYIFGGFLDNSGSSEEFWAFDMEAEHWRQILKRKPGSRHGHVAVTSLGCMWIHGGMRNLTYLSDLWCYNFALRTWKKVKGSGTFPALTGHTANIVRNDIVMVGGSRNGKPSSDVWIFSLNHDTWRCVETPRGITFPPISLHKSVLIDSTKLSQIDAEAAAKSVPNLKTPVSLLSWHQNESDVRPWTSPAPESQEGSAVKSMPKPDVQVLTLLDKNNNSEEDITGLHAEDSLCECSNGTPCLSHQKKILCSHTSVENNSVFDIENQQNNVVANSKSDILKIRPASYEGCCDESPLLERFQSIESDVDLGESNAVMTLSDESLFVRPTREDLLLFQSSCHLDNLAKFSQDIAKKCHSSEGILEPSCGTYTALHSYHNSAFVSSSDTYENKSVSLNSCHARLSVSSDDKENFFANPLYESVYEKALSPDQSNENVSENATNTSHHCHDRINSSDLVIEDLEFCEDDLTLRNIDIAFPSKATIRWLSLKDLSSSCDSQRFCSDGQVNLNLSPKARSHSLSDIESESNNKSPSLHGKLEDIKDYAHAKVMKYSRLHSINDVKKQSRNSHRISKTYVKHSAASQYRNSGSHFAHQKQDFSSSREGQLHPGDSNSSHPISSESRKVSSPKDTCESYKHFIVQSNSLACGFESDFQTGNKTLRKFGSSTESDKSQILIIFGGQTEVLTFDTEYLKIWNCYLF